MGLSPGARLGRYEVISRLGAGGMGEVYRARDTELDREVAVKVLPQEVAGDPVRVERFRKEGRAIARLAHPNILEIWDFGSDGGISYAVTELLEGSSLREEIETGSMSPKKARQIAASIAEGLAAAHDKGIVHRDLKPENVFITTDDRVKILDFGLARTMLEVGPEDATGTFTPADTIAGTVMGTVGYMAPEQIRGEPADARSDIFGLGCVLYEMLSGRRAFARETAVETMSATLNDEPRPLSGPALSAGSALPGIVERCLEKKPERRFQTASDLAFALRAAASEPARSSPVTVSSGVDPQRHRWRIAGALLAVLLAIGIVGWQLLRGPSPATDEVGLLPRPSLPTPVESWLVVVEPFDNRTGDSELDVVSEALSEILLDELGRVGRGLASLPPVMVVPAGSEPTDPSFDPSGSTSARGGLRITGSFADDGDDLEITARIREIDDGRVLYTAPPTVVSSRPDREQLDDMVQRLMGAVGVDLHVGLDHVSHVPDYSVLFDFLSGVEEVWSGNLQGLVGVERAFKADPEFLRSAWFLSGPMVLSTRYDEQPEYVDHMRARSQRLTEFERLEIEVLESWYTGPAGQGLSAARRLQQLAPNDVVVRFYRAKFADDLNRPREVVEAVADAIERVPRRFSRLRRAMHFRLRRSYDRLGEHHMLLELGRQMREEAPGDTFAFMAEAVALVGLDRLGELDALIEECSSLPGGECDSASLMVRISMYLEEAGHRQHAIAYGTRAARELESLSKEELARREYSYVNALRAAGRWDDFREAAERRAGRTDISVTAREWGRACVGMAAARTGDRTTAAGIADDLEASGNYAYAAYVVSYLGQLDRAVELLRRSIEEEPGFGIGHFVRWDPDLAPLRGYPPFEELIAPRG